MRKKAATGRCEGRKPYGERDGEQEVLARMSLLRYSGLTYLAIAEQLNAEGPRARNGAEWRSGIVHRILSREP